MNRMQSANKAKEAFIAKMKLKQKLSIGEKEVLYSLEHIKPDKDGSIILYESNVKNSANLSMNF